MPNLRTITIEESSTGKLTITSIGFSEIEVLGVLRYSEKTAWISIYESSQNEILKKLTQKKSKK